MNQEKNEMILKQCLNYDHIINFEIEESDFVSKRLIHYYQTSIFEIDIYKEEEISKVVKLDQAMGEYIKKGKFYKKLQNELWKEERHRVEEAYFIELIEKIIELYEIDQTESMNTFVHSMWL